MLSRPAAGVIAGLVIAGAAGVYYLSTSGSHPSEAKTADPGPAASVSAPTPGSVKSSAGSSARPNAQATPKGGAVPTISRKESTIALCQVRTVAVRSLLAGTKGTAQYEALRDAIPALGDRIQVVQSAANGRPAVQPVVVAVQDLYDDWSTALRSYDNGKTSASTKAMHRANSRLNSLDSTLESALPASVNCA